MSCSGSIQRVSSCEALGKRGGDSGAGDSELCISRLPFPHSHHLLQGYQEVRFNLVPSLIQMSRNFCRAALNWHECTWVCPYMECGCVLISLKRIQSTSVWLRLCVYIKTFSAMPTCFTQSCPPVLIKVTPTHPNQSPTHQSKYLSKSKSQPSFPIKSHPHVLKSPTCPNQSHTRVS